MERERKVGGRLVTTPPKSITSAFVCDISGVCCHCHMASQGSLDWFRAETVIQDCNCSPSTVPSRGLGLISSGTQPVTEVKGEQLTSHGGDQTQLFRMIFSCVLLSDFFEFCFFLFIFLELRGVILCF